MAKTDWQPPLLIRWLAYAVFVGWWIFCAAVVVWFIWWQAFGGVDPRP